MAHTPDPLPTETPSDPRTLGSVDEKFIRNYLYHVAAESHRRGDAVLKTKNPEEISKIVAEQCHQTAAALTMVAATMREEPSYLQKFLSWVKSKFGG